MKPFATLAVVLAAGIAAPADTQPLARGQAMAEAFVAGDTDPLWAEMSARMQDALGTASDLAAFRDEIGRQFGEEVEVTAEGVTSEGNLDVYQRSSRWTESPPALRMQVALDPEGRVAGFRVEPLPAAAETRHLDYDTRATLRLPFDGAWHVFWGGRTIEGNYHAADVGQRFAVDFVVMRDGASHSGDPAVLENYHCWGRPILAPAPGVVVRASDGLPDMAIGDSDPANPAGNHVVIDFGRGEYGFLAHLMQGSLTVSDGDRVAVGEEVGRCGNSGNTSEPHLHFHLQTSPTLGEGEGLPAQFAAYLADGRRVEDGEPTKGQTVEPLE